MNPFFNVMNNPMINFMRQVQAIKENPNQLAALLRQRGMISDSQVSEIQAMGSDYQKIGQYLIRSGRLPENVQGYKSQIEQVQGMMNQSLANENNNQMKGV